MMVLLYTVWFSSKINAALAPRLSHVLVLFVTRETTKTLTDPLNTYLSFLENIFDIRAGCISVQFQHKIIKELQNIAEQLK